MIPSSATSFPIGSGESICSAQDAVLSKARVTIFDRSWTIVCRDASRPIGQVYALDRQGDMAARVEEARLETLTCAAPGTETVEDLGGVTTRNCRSDVSGARWKSYVLDRARKHFVVEGVAGYDQALQLALRSVVEDKVFKDPISTPLLGSEGGASYYRLQALQSDATTRLEQGYRSNNAGSFAEAVEYFDPDTTGAAETADADNRTLQHEMLVNRALQLSNLGKFAQADASFAKARAMHVNDPVQARLARNLETIHEINQGVLDLAQAILDQPISPAPRAVVEKHDATVIEHALSGPLDARSAAVSGAFTFAGKLSPDERSALLDAQAMQLAGTIARLSGRDDTALAKFDEALGAATSVRSGRVTASYRLRAQIMTEKALLLENDGRLGEAEALLRQVYNLINNEYPESLATQAATAGLAAFLARHGRDDEALTLYRKLATQLIASRARLVGLSNRIAPYFNLLVQRVPSDPAAVGDLFLISQTLARPGAAGTLEQLSREMAVGDDRGAALYRQSIGLRRDIERTMIQIAQMSNPQASGAASDASEIARLKATAAELSAQQVQTLDELSRYPRFRAISSGVVTLPDMLALLKPGEAYAKVAEIGDALYAIYISHGLQTAWRLPITAAQLDDRVTHLRDTISLTINGVQSTYPFDVDTARALYLELFSPVQDDLRSVRHLIFEPDGALLQLPINLLIADQASVEAYHARAAKPGADPYDFRGIDWLGRNHAISTALSAASFRDVRNLPPSTAERAYLGLGHNQPVSAATLPVAAQKLRGINMQGGDDGTSCNWPLAAWNNPIADSELRQAARVYGEGEADLVTGAQFSDTAIMARTDLADFKVIHFATHGMIGAPRRSCEAQPALLTSFGSQGSDGLLEFKEIFDLHLNADLVVLSACDTAGGATEAATRSAGIETGGGSALDGLVRAFIGAGSRTVIASHWPAPDDYQATYRLMTAFLGAPAGTNLGEALRKAELALMDDQETSHPFYWSGFALIGDGAQPVPKAH